MKYQLQPRLLQILPFTNDLCRDRLRINPIHALNL